MDNRSLVTGFALDRAGAPDAALWALRASAAARARVSRGGGHAAWQLGLLFLLAQPGLLGGCTLEDGRGYARLSGRLAASLPPLAADPEAWITTRSGVAVQVASLQLTVHALSVKGTLSGPAPLAQHDHLHEDDGDHDGEHEQLPEDAEPHDGQHEQAQGASWAELQLAAAQAPGEPCVFDPANPPAGCGACHGGHCHCDGRLISYEELEAALCGEQQHTAGITTLALLEVEHPLELAARGGALRALEACSPSCELGRGSVERVGVVLERLELVATVQDESGANGWESETLQLQAQLALPELQLEVALAPAALVDRDHRYSLELQVELALPAGLFDVVPWRELEAEGTQLLINSARNSAAAAALREELRHAALRVRVVREGD